MNTDEYPTPTTRCAVALFNTHRAEDGIVINTYGGYGLPYDLAVTNGRMTVKAVPAVIVWVIPLASFVKLKEMERK